MQYKIRAAVQLFCAGFFSYNALHDHTTASRILDWVCVAACFSLIYYLLTRIKKREKNSRRH